MCLHQEKRPNNKLSCWGLESKQSPPIILGAMSGNGDEDAAGESLIL